MNATSRKDKELTGRHVLLILLAFFGVMIAVNAYFTYAAVTTFRGEDVKRSYRQGLEYNTAIAARDAQDALGWSARVNMRAAGTGEQEIIVTISGRDQRAISGLSMTGVLRHPVDMSKDLPLTFVDTGASRFSAMANPGPGQWELRATATNDDTRFNFEQKLWAE